MVFCTIGQFHYTEETYIYFINPINSFSLFRQLQLNIFYYKSVISTRTCFLLRERSWAFARAWNKLPVPISASNRFLRVRTLTNTNQLSTFNILHSFINYVPLFTLESMTGIVSQILHWCNCRPTWILLRSTAFSFRVNSSGFNLL